MDRPALPDKESGPHLTAGQCAQLACMLEVTAPKVGNVHRGADFEDLTLQDFLISSVAICPAIDAAAGGASLGETVLSAVHATRATVRSNTNLGIILLLAPLACATRCGDLREGVDRVLGVLTPDDASDVYQAITLANPGGMNRVEESDIHDSPPDDLLEAMRLAADRDMIARQYADSFVTIWECVVPWLEAGLSAGESLTDVIIRVHVQLMATFPDSLILRKCGVDIARQSQIRANKALAAGAVGSENYLQALGDLDFWLRADGHRRNPGTSADLVAAGLFVLLRSGIIKFPLP